MWPVTLPPWTFSRMTWKVSPVCVEEFVAGVRVRGKLRAQRRLQQRDEDFLALDAGQIRLRITAGAWAWSACMRPAPTSTPITSGRSTAHAFSSRSVARR